MRTSEPAGRGDPGEEDQAIRAKNQGPLRFDGPLNQSEVALNENQTKTGGELSNGSPGYSHKLS